MSKFKIKGIGLDTTHLDYVFSSEEGFDFLHTSISANNSSMISNYAKTFPDAQLITSIDFLDNAYSAVLSHILSLGRDNIKLLLIDASCDFKKYKEDLLALIEAGIVLNIGIKNPETPERIKEIKDELNFKIEYVSFPLCPFNFNYDLVSWCLDEVNEMNILGFNPFGGYLTAPSLISSFGVPYLLGFAARYSNVVFLSSRDPLLSLESKSYLETLVDQEADSMYDLKKSVSKLTKPLKKAIYTSLKLGDNILIPVDNPHALFSPSEAIQKLGKSEIKMEFPEITDKDELKLVDEVLTMYQSLKKPEDLKEDADFISIILPRVLGVLRLEFPDSIISEAKLGERTFLISKATEKTSKKFLSKKITTDFEYFLFFYSEDSGFIFQKVVIATEEASES